MDQRTPLEKLLWERIGPPLYYCDLCKKAVEVVMVDGTARITKPCGHTEATVIAPRKATLSGEGFAGLSLPNKVKVKAEQLGAKLTGRNV